MLKHTLGLLMGALMAPNDGMGYGGTSGPLPPTYRDGFGINTLLTDVAVEKMLGDANFAAPQIFPIVKVADQGGRIRTWNRGDMLRNDMRLHDYGDRPKQITYRREMGEGYFCEHKDAEKVITPQDRATNARNYSPMKKEEDAVAVLTRKAAIDLDQRWAEKAFSANSSWAWQYQGVSGSPSQVDGSPEFTQLDQLGVNPAQLIRAKVARMLAATGFEMNTLVLGIDVYLHLVFNEDIVDRIKYVQKGVADLDLMAEFFGVERIIVPKSVYNAAPEGVNDDIRLLVDPKGMLLTYTNPNPSVDSPSGGYMVVWEELYRQFEGEQNQVLNDLALIRKGYDSRSGVRWVQIHTAVDFVNVAPDLGAYFTDVVATTFVGNGVNVPRPGAGG